MRTGGLIIVGWMCQFFLVSLLPSVLVLVFLNRLHTFRLFHLAHFLFWLGLDILISCLFLERYYTYLGELTFTSFFILGAGYFFLKTFFYWLIFIRSFRIKPILVVFLIPFVFYISFVQFFLNWTFFGPLVTHW